MNHKIIPSEEGLVKSTEELNKQIAQEMLLPDETKHTTAQVFQEGEDLDRRGNISKDNKDSQTASP